jgi:uncharacterized protein YqiB (DUF1249 family)
LQQLTQQGINRRRKQNAYQLDLPALMAVCETNYWKLRKLLLPIFPRLQAGDEFVCTIPSVDRRGGGRRLVLSIQERCPYTSTLDLAEISGDPSLVTQQETQWGASPRLTVRIYHDAKTAEVIAFQGQRHFMSRYEYPNPQMRQRDEKFQLNALLADWLNCCLQHGCRTFDY